MKRRTDRPVERTGQYRRFSCRMMSNFAVSAIAITAITPA
jgi:hypothetical protein